MLKPQGTSTQVCPKCNGAVGFVETGTEAYLCAHTRYADGSGSGPNQPHKTVNCEGSGMPVLPN